MGRALKVSSNLRDLHISGFPVLCLCLTARVLAVERYGLNARSAGHKSDAKPGSGATVSPVGTGKEHETFSRSVRRPSAETFSACVQTEYADEPPLRSSTKRTDAASQKKAGTTL
jgi:hypothetical protein